MFYASTGLVAIGAWMLEKVARLQSLGFGWLPTFVAVLGIVIAAAWVGSMVLGRFYEERLFADMQSLWSYPDHPDGFAFSLRAIMGIVAMFISPCTMRDRARERRLAYQRRAQQAET